MEKNIKFVIIGIIGSFCFLGLLLYSFGYFPWLEAKNSDDEEISDNPDTDVYNITLEVDFSGAGPDTKLITEISLKQGENTVFDVLNQHCSIEYDIYPNDRYFITSIDGVEGSWIYFIGADQPMVPANEYVLSDNDTVLWEYKG